MISQRQLDELWDFNDPTSSAQRLQQAADDATGEERSEYLTQVARAFGLQDRFDEALAVLEGITSTEPVVTTRAALEHGRIENSSGHPDRAVPFFRTAAELAGRHDLQFLRIDALHMLAIADPDHAADWTDEAVRLAEAASDDRTRRWLISLHNNHGWTLYDAGDRDGAVAEFELAVELAQAIGTPAQQRYAREALAEARRD